jgi:hypothetical protein
MTETEIAEHCRFLPQEGGLAGRAVETCTRDPKRAVTDAVHLEMEVL